uniref:Ubiquitin-like domain-containing protein n=1 Tax=Amphimedon queenslandica TaxID=400682 RepID=A0A1X7UCA5_AMPQE
MSAGKTNRLDVKPYNTVKEIKQIMEEKEGIPLTQQKLYYMGCELKNDQSVSECEFNDYTYSEVHLVCRSQSPIQIKVLTPDSKQITLTVDGTDTIETIKRKMKEFPPSQHALVFAGKELQDNLTLYDQSIQNGSMLHLKYKEPALSSTLSVKNVTSPVICDSIPSINNDGTIASSGPSLPDLLNDIAAKAPNQWMKIGLMLGISFLDLMSIKEKNEDDKICYANIFHIWKTADTRPYSWETMVVVLKSDVINDSQLANAISRHGSFSQAQPNLYNPFIEDAYLRHYLSYKLPNEVRNDVFRDLESFGARVSSEITILGREAEINPPTLHQYDGWGIRIDKLATSEAWRKLHDISAEEGLVAIGYDRKHSEWSRLHQFSKLFLFSPSSGLYSCPLAMTDGAARLIEVMKLKDAMAPTYNRLTSRDPSSFWTSGQWMTEKGGGSDVARGTASYALLENGDRYRLHGYKWFSSATDADMAFTLARVQDESGQVTDGTEGISLFYVETRDNHGSMNNIRIERLKNKLGTRQLPTAELLLDGTLAQLIGEKGRGISLISPMLLITRLHNTISAVASMRRMLLLSRDYATKRRAFGKFLVEHSLHMRTLAELELETRGCMVLALELTALLGREECGQATKEEIHLLRLFTPVAKLYTAKKAMSVMSEGLESFGGQGYIEDNGLPTLFRDAQVLPIWEGTTNIMSLDVLRALQKSNGEVLEALVSKVDRVTCNQEKLQFLGLEAEAELIKNWTQSVTQFSEEGGNVIVTAARDFAISLGQVYTGTLLLEKACHSSANILDFATLKRWCKKSIPLRRIEQYDDNSCSLDTHLVMDGHRSTLIR